MVRSQCGKFVDTELKDTYMIIHESVWCDECFSD